jgi:hypothetical protein
MPHEYRGPVTFVIACLVILYLLYVLYKVAEHVQAWPFG